MKAKLLCGLGLLLAGCATSAPSHFYTLLPAPQAPTPLTAPFRIDVQPVTLPEEVATQQMVVRVGAGELVPVETRRWIAPLADEFRAALSADLSRRLGAQDLHGLAGRSGTVYHLELKVQRFESALGSYARIDALWSLHRDGEAPGPVCTSSIAQPVAAGYDALALGHQQAISTLAGQIAASISAAQQSRAAPACGG